MNDEEEDNEVAGDITVYGDDHRENELPSPTGS